jgi:FkbM family methyltransferase
VLDVGAHTGEYGDFLRDIGYDGWIVSFEPVEDNFETLRRRTAEDSKWSAYQFALGAEEKSMAMNVTRSRVFSSFHEPNAFCKGQFQERGAVERRELVTMRRLDRVFDEVLPPIADPRVYLKMDTQGWDLQVLEGATGMLDRVAGLQSEVSVQKIYSGMPGYLDSLAVMERLGFELVELVPVSRKDNLAVIEFDALMIRRAGMRASPSPALRHQDFALNPKA